MSHVNYFFHDPKFRRDGSPRIGARKLQHSPNKTTSTAASDTLLGDLSSLHRQDSATFSTDGDVPAVPRNSRSRSPSKRTAAAVLERYEEVVGRQAQESSEARQCVSEPCGLDFLLQACDILEPEEVRGYVSCILFYLSHIQLNPSIILCIGESAFKINAQQHTSCSPRSRGAPTDSQQQSRSGRTRRPRRYSNDEDYSANDSSEDDEYRPGARGRNSRRSSRVSALANEGRTSTGTPGSTGRWERGMVTGPCTNPDCEHPYDSPQWRKGPPQHPILCNACGTRWLRNGSLKPLVPRRGIRYNKPKPRLSKAAKAAQMAATAPSSLVMHGDEDDAMMEVCHPGDVTSQPQVESFVAPQQLPPRVSVASLATANDALVKAMASIQELPLSNINASAIQIDHMALQQQLAAMAAAAKAAQQAFAAVAQVSAQHMGSNVSGAASAADVVPQLPAIMQQQQQQQLSSSPSKGEGSVVSPLPSRPVFSINAVAGPPMGPMFMSQNSSEFMQTDK